MAISAIVQTAVFSYVKANWDETVQGPIQYENQPNPAAEPGVLHTSLVIVPNEAARVRNSIGAPKLITNYGFLFFTTYAPQEKGSLKQKALCDYIQNLVDDVRLSLPTGRTFVLDISAPQTLGQRDGTYRIAVSAPYHYDEW